MTDAIRNTDLEAMAPNVMRALQTLFDYAGDFSSDAIIAALGYTPDSAGLKSQRVTLAKGDILTLDTVPVTLIPAVANAVLMPLYCIVQGHGTIGYTYAGSSWVNVYWGNPDAGLVALGKTISGADGAASNIVVNTKDSGSPEYRMASAVSGILAGAFGDPGQLTQTIPFNYTLTGNHDYFYLYANKELTLKAPSAFAEITNGVIGFAINNGGSGYIVNDLLSDDSSLVGFVADAVDGGGAITALRLINGGSGQTVNTNLTLNGGSGSGATFDITSIGVSDAEVRVTVFYYVEPAAS